HTEYGGLTLCYRLSELTAGRPTGFGVDELDPVDGGGRLGPAPAGGPARHHPPPAAPPGGPAGPAPGARRGGPRTGVDQRAAAPRPSHGVEPARGRPRAAHGRGGIDGTAKKADSRGAAEADVTWRLPVDGAPGAGALRHRRRPARGSGRMLRRRVPGRVLRAG